MLLKLMRKDLILHWRGIVPMLVVAIGLLIYAVLRDGEELHPSFFLVMISLMAGFVPATVAAREEKMRTRVLTSSLPVSRTSAVAARYLGSWILFGIFAAIMLLGFLLARGPAVLSGVFSPQTVFGMLTAFTVTAVLVMPFTERFGFMGLFVLLIVLQVLGLLAMASTILMPGRPSVGTIIGAVQDGIRGFVANSKRGLGLAGYYALFALALALINVGSFAVSAAIGRRREL
jgi:hypothetical protein